MKGSNYLTLLRAKVVTLGFTFAENERTDDGRLVAVAFRDPSLPLKAEGSDEVAATLHLLKVITRP